MNNNTMSNNTSSDSKCEEILWSSVSRNGTILAQAPEGDCCSAVLEAVQGIRDKEITAGYEYYTPSRLMIGRRSTPQLKAVKFHVHESLYDEYGDSLEFTLPVVWVFSAVYNPSKWENPKNALSDVQAALQKIVSLTEEHRRYESHPKWREGIQELKSFSPILLKTMQEAPYHGKMARLQEAQQRVKDQMESNIEAILQNEAMQLNRMNNKADRLVEMAEVFKKNSKSFNEKMRRERMWQSAKHGAILGGVIAVGCAIPFMLAL